MNGKDFFFSKFWFETNQISYCFVLGYFLTVPDRFGKFVTNLWNLRKDLLFADLCYKDRYSLRMPLYQESSIKSIRFEDRLIGKISSLHLGMDSVQLPTTLTTRGPCLSNEVQTCRPMSIILRDDFTSRHADKL